LIFAAGFATFVVGLWGVVLGYLNLLVSGAFSLIVDVLCSVLSRCSMSRFGVLLSCLFLGWFISAGSAGFTFLFSLVGWYW
jgi:hypothetical protein